MLFKNDASISIVIPAQATDREHFTAKELQKYLNISNQNFKCLL